METITITCAVILLAVSHFLIVHRINQLDKHVQMLSNIVFECIEEVEKNERKTKTALNTLYGCYADTDSVKEK